MPAHVRMKIGPGRSSVFVAWPRRVSAGPLERLVVDCCRAKQPGVTEARPTDSPSVTQSRHMRTTLPGLPRLCRPLCMQFDEGCQPQTVWKPNFFSARRRTSKLSLKREPFLSDALACRRRGRYIDSRATAWTDRRRRRFSAAGRARRGRRGGAWSAPRSRAAPGRNLRDECDRFNWVGVVRLGQWMQRPARRRLQRSDHGRPRHQDRRCTTAGGTCGIFPTC